MYHTDVAGSESESTENDENYRKIGNRFLLVGHVNQYVPLRFMFVLCCAPLSAGSKC